MRATILTGLATALAACTTVVPSDAGDDGSVGIDAGPRDSGVDELRESPDDCDTLDGPGCVFREIDLTGGAVEGTLLGQLDGEPHLRSGGTACGGGTAAYLDLDVVRILAEEGSLVEITVAPQRGGEGPYHPFFQVHSGSLAEALTLASPLVGNTARSVVFKPSRTLQLRVAISVVERVDHQCTEPYEFEHGGGRLRVGVDRAPGDRRSAALRAQRPRRGGIIDGGGGALASRRRPRLHVQRARRHAGGVDRRGRVPRRAVRPAGGSDLPVRLELPREGATRAAPTWAGAEPGRATRSPSSSSMSSASARAGSTTR